MQLLTLTVTFVSIFTVSARCSLQKSLNPGAVVSTSAAVIDGVGLGEGTGVSLGGDTGVGAGPSSDGSVGGVPPEL